MAAEEQSVAFQQTSSDTEEETTLLKGFPENQGLVSSFHEKYKRDRESSVSLRDQVRKKCGVLAERKWWTKTLLRNFPFLRILKGYSLKGDFPNDLVAGITVGIMQIPQSMAYAMLASLPPICGLYTALFAPIVYFFVGSSKHISMGVIAIVGLMIGTVLDREVNTDDLELSTFNSSLVNSTGSPNSFSETDLRKIQVATALSFVSGLVIVLFGKLGLGVVTSYMSEPLVSGFTTGAATQVITSQIKHVFGVKVPRYNGIFKVIKTWIAFFSRIPATNLAALIMSLICIVCLYLVKIQVNQRFKSKMKVPIPIELIVVILGTVASHFGQFNDKYGLDIVEEIPAGMPSPRLPDLSLTKSCFVDAVIIGIVAFAQSVSMAKIFAKKNGYKIDSNQEMVGYGAGSIFASLFSGYITAASVARSSVQESAGGKTQIASLFSCAIVFVVVMAVGPLFYNLPTCVLAAVIIVSLRSLFLQFLDIKTLWRVSKYDLAIWLVTFLGVVVLDADYGLGLGIMFSLLTVVIRTQRKRSVLVGEVNSTGVYRSTSHYNEVKDYQGVVILSYTSPLYFANADGFVRSVHKALNIHPQKVKKRREFLKNTSKEEGYNEIEIEILKLNGEKTELGNDERGTTINHVIIECSGISFLDTMGIKALKEVILDFSSIDIEVSLANCTDESVDIFQRTDFMDKYGDRIYLTVQDALLYKGNNVKLRTEGKEP